MYNYPAMKIQIAAIHLDNASKAKHYALKKISHLTKYNHHIEGINVRLIAKKAHRGQEQDFYCELTIHTPGHRLEIVDIERDIDKAVDRAIEKAKVSLVRSKEKEQSKKHKEALVVKKSLHN